MRAIRSAEAKDRERMKGPRQKGKAIRAASNGSKRACVESHRQKAIDTWVDDARDRFRGIAIRRHLHSVDNTGARISGLGDILHHSIGIDVYPHETENIEQLAKDLEAAGGRGSSVSPISVVDSTGL